MALSERRLIGTKRPAVVPTTPVQLPAGSNQTGVRGRSRLECLALDPTPRVPYFHAGGSSYNNPAVVNSNGCLGGPGAGGAIHLIAPTVTGNGLLTAVSGNGYENIGVTQGYAGFYTGLVRFSTTNNTFTGPVDGTANVNAFGSSYFVSGPIYNPPANSTLSLPSLSITQVNGTAVPANPSGNPATPDIQISATTPVTINIAATNIPVGTIVTLRLTSGTSGDAVVSCNALGGTAAASTATCSATFPFSVSLASLRASW